jgi:NADPH:quinone reductase-like Zn-dependent oxidoreductase
MRAVRFYEYGGPEVLHWEECPVPEPGQGEVLLRVHVTSVRRTDLSQRSGQGDYFKSGLPFQLGRESSGVVAGLGPGVAGWREGDEAITKNNSACGECRNCREGTPEACRNMRYQGVSSWGGYAEYITVPAGTLLRKLESVSHAAAAGFQGGTITAWHSLIDQARLQPGETVLIPSATGAVGSGGVAVAKHSGARVIATVRGAEKAKRIVAFGADEAIDYESEDLRQRVHDLTGGRGVDVLFDTVGGPEFQQRALLIRPGGRIVMPGAAAGSQLSFGISALIANQATVHFSKGSRPSEADIVLDLLAQGRLKVAFSHVFPLADAAEAHRCIERREQIGRVLLDVAGSDIRPNI